MKKVLVFMFLVLLSIGYADFSVNFSSFGDSSTYLSSNGVKGSLIFDKTTLAMYLSRTETPVSIKDRWSLNADTDIADKISCFGFYQGDFGTTRIGVGAGYQITQQVLDYPWAHKISFALVQDSEKGVIPSLRYKFQGYWEKIGYKAVYFQLGYTQTIDQVLSYKLSSMFSLIYTQYNDTASGYHQGTVGGQMNL